MQTQQTLKEFLKTRRRYETHIAYLEKGDTVLDFYVYEGLEPNEYIEFTKNYNSRYNGKVSAKITAKKDCYLDLHMFKDDDNNEFYVIRNILN